MEELLSNDWPSLSKIKSLVRSGSNLDRVDCLHNSVLHLSVEHPHILKYFLEQNVNPMSENLNGETPLHLAAKVGNLDSAMMLLTNINTQDIHGNTPLHLAMRHPKMVKLLLDCGARPNIRNDEKCKPIHLTDDPALVSLLLSFGSSKNDMEPLLRAVREEHEQMILCIMSHGVSGKKAIKLAREMGKDHIVDLLLELDETLIKYIKSPSSDIQRELFAANSCGCTIM